jgi:hypothetical protein
MYLNCGFKTDFFSKIQSAAKNELEIEYESITIHNINNNRKNLETGACLVKNRLQTYQLTLLII